MSSIYSRGAILAPMVRMGTLPSRLLALRHGANLVYTEELIDHKLMRCKRVENPVLKCRDFIDLDGRVVFRTNDEEKDRVILQLGTADPARALQCAKLVADDVAGIDVNMGCPKPFSVKGGMGAALLRHPDKIVAILTTLVQGLPHKSITCKIRVLKTLEETVELARLIESTGVKALAVHGRLTEQRPREPLTPYQIETIKAVVAALKIPVIANGGSLDIKTSADIEAFRSATTACSVMVARAAQWNLSVFRKDGPLPIHDVVIQYLKVALEWDNGFENTKYCISSLLKDQLTTELGLALGRTRNIREIYELFGLQDEFDVKRAYIEETSKALGYVSGLVDDQTDDSNQASIGHLMHPGDEGEGPEAKKAKVEDGVERVHIDVSWKQIHRMAKVPKSFVFEYAFAKQIAAPTFDTQENPLDRKFKSTITFQDKKFTTVTTYQSKKHAEHAATIAALLHFKLWTQADIPDPFITANDAAAKKQ